MDTSQLSLHEKRELVRRLLRQKGAPSDAVAPMSHGQQALWFVYRLAPDSPAYNFLCAIRVKGDVDVTTLQRACQALVDRHPLLRATFRQAGPTPVQTIPGQHTVCFDVRDAGDCGWEELLARTRAEADRPFDLERGPAYRITLFRRGGRDQVLAFVAHHIIADLWSMDVLIHELRELYAAESAGTSTSLPPPTAHFADYVRWQTAQLAGPRGQKALAFWKERLAGELPVLNLPTDRPRPPVMTYRGAAHDWTFDPALVHRLRQLAREQGVTLFTVLLAAFQVLLHRCTGQDDLIVGTTTAGRDRPEWERVVGYFLNQLPLRADLSGAPPFSAFLRQVRQTVLEGLEYPDYPLSLLVEQLHLPRDSSRSPLFQTMFIWDKPRELGVGNDEPSGSSLALAPVLMEQRGAPFDLVLAVFEVGGSLTASLKYNTDLFDPETATRLAGCYTTLLRGIADDPDRCVALLPLLTPSERRTILETWNETSSESPPGAVFSRQFEARAVRTPTATALVYDQREIRYGELNRRANRLARVLHGRGIGRGHLVGVCVPRGTEMIVATLAIWKAGAAYLPLDPTYPEQRLAWMVADAKPAVVLTQPSLIAHLDAVGAPLLVLDGLDATGADTNLPGAAGPDDLAYVIYTSGSTGRPKGTLLTHRGLIHLCHAQSHVFDVGPESRVLQFASAGFDASIFEIALALANGAALVLAPQTALLPGPGFVRLLRDQGVTHAVLPPSALTLTPFEELPALRSITVAGESCPAALVDRWGRGRVFFNAYGPTEASVWTTCARCQPGSGAPPIGRPVPNARVYVLDRRLQPVPVGVPGELYLAGPQLALGYLNQPELTATRFIPNPFANGDHDTLYRTGDLVRWQSDGQLQFLGRLDQQVKLRGYRIELAEIEAVIREFPEVQDALVLTRRGEGEASERLTAYVVTPAPDRFPTDALMTTLRQRLPVYMLPSDITPLTAFPLTANGKVDRSALPIAERASPRRGRDRTAPRDATEKVLASVWQRVLELETVGIHDNFFELGGASIQVLEVVSTAAESGLVLTPEQVFQHQTIAELAAVCGTVRSGALTLPEAERRDAAPRPILEATRAVRVETGRTVIESLGVYLPPKVVTTEEILRGCRQPLQFPLARMTGIVSRRMAGETEYSIDLAEQAARDCLARSAFDAAEIDLLICCNISRCDGPDYRFSYEPATAVQLRARLGLTRAWAFDVSNACAGMFTGIAAADALLRAGAVRRALVVSGEYITHLTRTAQQTIDTFMDPRLACLTLGDAGAAVTLECRRDGEAGFEELELYTLGKYSGLCIAKLDAERGGGPTMLTDPVQAAALAIHQSVGHALEVLKRRNWQPEILDQVILHQTSDTTLEGAVQEINSTLGRPGCNRGNVLFNLTERGNTATTTHFVALADALRAGRIRPGSKVLFGISGSGQTVGTALYTFDDLPGRTIHKPERLTPTRPTTSSPIRLTGPRVTLECVGISSAADTVTMLRQAGEDCLARCSHSRDDIGLVIHTGIYRSEFISEPALAAIAAGELGIHHEAEAPGVRRTLAFDLMNGPVGTLHACHLAAHMLAVGRTALILASEVENNATAFPEDNLGLAVTASALLLSSAANGVSGFSAFHFRSFPEHLDKWQTYTTSRDGKAFLARRCHPGLEDALLECASITVAELLQTESLRIADVKAVLPPHRSFSFVSRLGDVLGVPADRIVLVAEERDLSTSSLAYTFRHAQETGRLQPGDVILFLAIGGGIEVGCAIYRV